MRRSLAIAALGAALLVPPIWGQMRAGSRMAAPMGGRGFVSRSPAFVRSGVAFGHNPRFQVFFNQNPFFFRNCFFRRCPFFPQPFFFPVVVGGASYPIVIQTGQQESYDDRRQMAQEINRLSGEVERLREEQESRQLPPSPPPQAHAEKKSEPSAATVLVFRDKHIQEVHNFAIVGQTIWIFNEQRASKVPLSSLDVDATTKLNDERGVDFRLPK